MSHPKPFVVPLKPHDADESRKNSILLLSKDKRLPPLPSEYPRSLAPLQPGGAERALSRRSATVPSAPRGSSIKKTSSSSHHHPMYSIKLTPSQNTDRRHHHPPTAPPQPKCTTRRIVRRQLGGGGLTDSMSQQRSQYPHTDPASRRSEPTTIRAPGASNAEEERPSAAAGDSEDDEATLVSSSEAHVCQDSRDSSEGLVLFKDNGPKHPISLIHRRILDHIPGFSDDEGDDVHDIPSTAPRRRSRTRTPTPPSRCWGMRGTAHIEFEVTQEERAIISNTALKPPPWHQQSNEKQCG